MKQIFLKLFILLCAAMGVGAQGTWTSQNSGTTKGLKSVSCPTPMVCMAVGDSGTTVKTVDGGSSWTYKFLGNSCMGCSVYDLLSVSLADSLHGHVGGNGGAFYRTTDGENWSKVVVKSPAQSMIWQYVQLLGPDRGYVAGTYLSLISGTSGAHSYVNASCGRISGDSVIWTNGSDYRIGEPPALDVSRPAPTAIWFTGDSIGYVTLGDGTVHKTRDAAIHWAGQNVSNKSLWAIHFANEMVGYTAGDSGRIYKTVDSGAHWTAQVSGTTRNLKSVRFIDEKIGYAVGDSGTILATTNGGDLWTPMASSTTAGLNSVVLVGDGSVGYATGRGGVVLKLTGGTPTAIMTKKVLNPNAGIRRIGVRWYGFSLPDGRSANALGQIVPAGESPRP